MYRYDQLQELSTPENETTPNAPRPWTVSKPVFFFPDRLISLDTKNMVGDLVRQKSTRFSFSTILG